MYMLNKRMKESGTYNESLLLVETVRTHIFMRLPCNLSKFRIAKNWLDSSYKYLIDCRECLGV